MYANCDYANVVAGMKPEHLKPRPCRWLLVSRWFPLIPPCYCGFPELLIGAGRVLLLHRFVVTTVVTVFLTSICQGSPLSAFQFT